MLDRLNGDIANKAFAIGTTSRGHQSARWLSLEADSDQLITEDNWHELVDMEYLDIVNRLGCPVHVMLSGSRSVHLHIFFTHDINDKFLGAMKIVLGRALLNKYCSCSLESGMRLPGSIHQTTGELARYIGTQSQNDNAAFLQQVCACEYSSKELIPVIEELLDPDGPYKSKYSHIPLVVCNTKGCAQTVENNNESLSLPLVVCTTKDDTWEGDQFDFSSVDAPIVVCNTKDEPTAMNILLSLLFQYLRLYVTPNSTLGMANNLISLLFMYLCDATVIS